MKKYIVKDLKNIILYIFVSGIGAAFASLIPWITSSFINHIDVLSLRLIMIYLFGFIGAVIGVLILEYLTKVQGVKIEKNFVLSVRCDLFKGIMNMDYSTYGNEESGYYVGVLTEDVSSIFGDYFETLIGFFQNGIRIIVFFGFMFALNPVLSIVMFAFSVVSAIVPTFGGRKMAALRSNASNKNALYLTRIKELLSAFVVFTDKTENALIKRHDTACGERQQAVADFKINQSFFEIFTGLFCYLINVATFACGIILIWRGSLSAGEFVGMLSFIEILVVPVRDFSYLVLHYGASSEIKEKLEKILAIPHKTSTKMFEFNEIELSNVTYKNGDFLLDNISLKFQRGKKYAIIGKSGSGKSTLLKLIYGIFTPTSGIITMDGKEISDNSKMNEFAYIGQEAVIFQANGLDNITVFGSYQDANIGTFVEKTNSDNLIREDFGEDGSKISGGEKNKVALLRALCEGKRTLLCDEMFAALDKESKRAISEFILTDCNYTVISITHDVSDEMLHYYDEIIVMDEGKVKEIRRKSN